MGFYTVCCNLVIDYITDSVNGGRDVRSGDHIFNDNFKSKAMGQC